MSLQDRLRRTAELVEKTAGPKKIRRKPGKRPTPPKTSPAEALNDSIKQIGSSLKALSAGWPKLSKKLKALDEDKAREILDSVEELASGLNEAKHTLKIL